MIVNDQELLVSLAQLQELALALASVKQEALGGLATSASIGNQQCRLNP